MPNRTPKRTFLTRLSSLIIIKAAFVFVALWLVFYQPAGEPVTGTPMVALQSNVHALADSLAVVLPLTSIEHRHEIEMALAREVLEDYDLVTARVLAEDSTGQLSELFCYSSLAIDSSEIAPIHNALTQFSDSQLQSLLLLPADYQIASIGSARHSFFVQRLTLADLRPALLVAVAQHNLLISSRRSLATVLMILFLASGVITSLLVYSIRRRFQAPLRRLVRGMEQTAKGESFVMPEIVEDHELDSLASSFNTMSGQLLQQRRDLLETNRRLKESNQTLQESQLFLRALLDSTPLCVIATSADGRIMLFNRQAGSDFRCTQEESVGHNIREYITSRQKRMVAISDTNLAAGAQAFEARCQRRTREYFPAYVISAETRDAEGETQAIIYLIRDITESRSFQEMMVRLDRNYTRGEMAGDIAHEINNYLAILSGNLELMARVIDQGDREKIDKKLGIMKDTTDKIVRFTDGLMDVPQEETAFEKADLNQLVENVLAFLKPQNKFDKILIETELSPDLPLVEMDNAQIQQLLVNFIYNAAGALTEGTGERRIVIATQALMVAQGNYARIEVRDTGSGVAPDKRALLFQKRFTTKPKGHGIGLITCKRIVESHGGVVGYEDDSGTVFYCEIPVIHEHVDRTHAIAPPHEADPVESIRF